jgi:hypothetical protein
MKKRGVAGVDICNKQKLYLKGKGKDLSNAWQENKQNEQRSFSDAQQEKDSSFYENLILTC